MSKNRIKIPKLIIATRSEMETALGEVRAFTLDKIQLSARRDEKIKVIDDEFEPKFEALDLKLKARVAALETWAEQNPDDFGKLKSLEILHGKLGWRIGNWKTETLKGWNWDKVLTKVKDLKGKFGAYIRTKEEINRDQLIIDRADLTADDREKIGVRIFQEEAFFIEPNVTEVKAVEAK